MNDSLWKKTVWEEQASRTFANRCKSHAGVTDNGGAPVHGHKNLQSDVLHVMNEMKMFSQISDLFQSQTNKTKHPVLSCVMWRCLWFKVGVNRLQSRTQETGEASVTLCHFYCLRLRTSGLFGERMKSD